MEWLSLAHLVGVPVIKWVLQMFRGRTRRSIVDVLDIELIEIDIEHSPYWCPIILTLKVISKAYTKLRVLGIRYIVYQEHNPIQSGYWHSEMPVSSSGYSIGEIEITPKKDGSMTPTNTEKP